MGFEKGFCIGGLSAGQLWRVSYLGTHLPHVNVFDLADSFLKDGKLTLLLFNVFDLVDSFLKDGTLIRLHRGEVAHVRDVRRQQLSQVLHINVLLLSPTLLI